VVDFPVRNMGPAAKNDALRRGARQGMKAEL
jgi:hypothetical protein